ncbi:unnamed protein product [Pocillopora meandrina]|uniref:Uncharacterized protein n=1 Tax=Pocillopora meandrina TaxID=46732 RepID=A0AAU9WMV5_9CNID|nr:unnamed protein product [Pocillopora meandrina]
MKSARVSPVVVFYTETMLQSKKRVHIFNCDNTYELEPVEKLLEETKKKLSEKLSIHVEPVEKHSFRLDQMSEMVDKIRTQEMDMAFFVVHASESRLSINEDNAGIGYAKIYRALLQATGGDVVIVIGGDVNYESDDEENREVISRWAKRKVSSQFSIEYLDGRKSFIFSWNKQHRAIHEEALLHHFDPNKKGQMFHHQSPSTNQPPIPVLPSQAKSPELKNPQKPKSPPRRESSDPSFSNQRDAQGDLDYSQRNFPEEKSIHFENTQQLVWATQFSVKSPPTVLLRGFARYGKVPDQIGDLQIWDPEFKVPDDIQERLLKKLRNTPLIGMIVIKRSDGEIECYTDPNLKELSLDGEIQLAADEQLVLKTRLEPVEKLLDQFSIHVEKHSFRLPEMSEMIEKIPTLEMDMAFFVVHAHESRLSINEDNAGIGYAKIYRALLKATGGDVITVIGGDDNYKDDKEENGDVISSWAKRKVSSQFGSEYLDGRKSFIFSWNKQHRAVHEQALLHHFDTNKKG